MTFLNPILARDLWYRALREEYGLVIEIPAGQSPKSIETRMYDARREARDVSLNDLTIRISPDLTYFVIQRKQSNVLP